MIEPEIPLPCPFCGAQLVPNSNVSDLYVRRYGTHYDHPIEPCFLAGAEVSPVEISDWNRRTAPKATTGDPTP